jgi:hypothetical protein
MSAKAVEQGPRPGNAPPPHPQRTRRLRRTRPVAMRDRLRQPSGCERVPSTGPNPTDRGKLESKVPSPQTGRGSRRRWAPRPPTCTTVRAFSRSCAASRLFLLVVRQRAVYGRPPLYRAAASALKCTSEEPRNPFTPGGNRRTFCKEPGKPTCRKPGEVGQESLCREREESAGLLSRAAS